MLKDIEILEEYRTDSSPPINLYINCLKESSHFDRAAGYFSSSGLSEAAKGFAHFIDNNGKIRLVVSPQFYPEDIKAIMDGYKTRDQVVEEVLSRSIEEIQGTIERNRFEALAWLVSTNNLDIKIAIKVDKDGIPQREIYHEKMGIFKDIDGNEVAFTGSTNESKGGWVNNFESIDVYKSWVDAEKNRINRKRENFEKLWNNSTNQLTVEPLPKAIKKVIIKNKPSSPPNKEKLEEVNKIKDDLQNKEGKDLITTYHPIIKYPDWLNLSERKYQEDHVRLWKEGGYSGFFCMATGTGKTITALAAATDLYHQKGKLFILVTCPNNHLVEQWGKESRKFGFVPVLAFENKSKWVKKAKSECRSFIHGSSKVGMIISTQHALTDKNRTIMNLLEKIKTDELLYIADEAHNLGSFKTRSKLPKIFKHKIALTATPQRYFDDVGTKALFEYFGPQVPVEPEVDLKFAIENDYLCHYNYYPHLVYLNDEETEEYHELSLQIRRLSYLFDDASADDTRLEKLLIKRAKILNNAEEKYEKLESVLSEMPDIKKALFYCSDKQIENVIHILNDELNLFCKTVTHKDKAKVRKAIFNEFKNGIVDGLCAMGVLDEGLDIPSTKYAFFLSSTGNPKQFIQRRGRVLRKEKNIDKIAVLHDFIAIPSGNIEENNDIVKKALEREITRFKEFAEDADNKFEAHDVIFNIALDNDIVI